jgi:hypothetical protein
MISADGRKLRSQLAIATRRGNREEIDDLKRRFWARQLADTLRDGLAEATLTAEQLDELKAVIDAAPRCP